MKAESRKIPGLAALVLSLAACGASTPQTPYPAFIEVDELPGVFLAGLPGVEAEQLAGNPKTRRSSNRILLPPEWNFTTGASPGKSVELFVLHGSVQLGDIDLGPGGYAYVPSGSTGIPLRSDAGAQLLYFLDDADPKAVIQTPLILDSNLKGWQAQSADPHDLGISVKLLREDPGSGARTWLMRAEPVASRGWQSSSVTREGYLVSGTWRDTECVNGESLTKRCPTSRAARRPDRLQKRSLPSTSRLLILDLPSIFSSRLRQARSTG